MRFLVRFIFFAGLFLLTGLQACETQKKAVSFPADHMHHPAVLTEWWYFVGHLKTTESKELTYGFCLFRASPFLYIAHLSLTDQQENNFIFDRLFYRPKKTTLDKNKRLISYNGKQVIVQTGDNDFHIKGSWQGIELDLELKTQKPPMMVNGNARIGMPEGGQSSYYSLTRMATKGTISAGGRALSVSGLSWMDHQWGNFHVRNKGWDWFCIQMDDSTEYNLYSFRNRSGKTLKQFANLLDEKNNLSTYHSIEIKSTDHWKNELTGRNYITGWKLILPGRKDTFLLVAQTENQEIYAQKPRDFLPNYWEGSCIVEKHTADGRKVYGRAFAEHFPVPKRLK